MENTVQNKPAQATRITQVSKSDISAFCHGGLIIRLTHHRLCLNFIV